MKLLHVIASAFFAGFLGIGFFLFQGQYIIVKLPWFSYPSIDGGGNKAVEVQREVMCHVWKDGAVRQSKKNILLSQDHGETIKRVVSAWLAVGVDENCLEDDAKLLSVALTNQGTVALLVFNKSFLPIQLSTQGRWQLVESLLSTLRAAGMVLEGVYFLQNQSIMPDDYLDFSQRWPIGGYHAR